jgi:hypothetical protein
VKIRDLWYDDEKALAGYRGTLSSRGGSHKGKWLIRRDPRDRRAVFFQDPLTHDWHRLRWTGLPQLGQMPAFGDARVRELMRAAKDGGLRPKTDAELLPVLLELIGSSLPVSSWPTRMSKTQRTGHAREVAQAEAASTDRPEPAPQPTVVASPRWPQRAQAAADSVDAERRRRREAAVPVTPEPPPALGAGLRARSLLFVPDEEDQEGPGAATGSG